MNNVTKSISFGIKFPAIFGSTENCKLMPAVMPIFQIYSRLKFKGILLDFKLEGAF